MSGKSSKSKPHNFGFGGPAKKRWNDDTENQELIGENDDFGNSNSDSDSPLLKKYDTKTRTIADAALVIAIIVGAFSILGVIGFFLKVTEVPTNENVKWTRISQLISKRDITMPLSPAPGNYFLDLPNITLLVHPTNPQYQEKNYRLLSRDPTSHIVVISDGGATWDKGGLFKILRFLPMVGCYVDFDVIDENKVIVNNFIGVEACNANFSHCEILKANNIHASTGIFDMLEADMFTQPSLKHSTDGPIPSTHNNHDLDGGANPLHKTLPLDSSYVGKTMRICSTGNQKDTLILPGGMFWESTNSFSVLQFEEKSPCCVEIHIIAPDKIDVSRSKECSRFCIDTIETSCIDPERPLKTNKWHGWWRNNMWPSEILFPGSSPVIFINATIYPMTINLFGATGSLRRLRTLPPPPDGTFPLIIADAGVNRIATMLAPDIGIDALEKSSILYSTLVFQENSDTFVVSIRNKQYFEIMAQSMVMYNRTTSSEIDQTVKITPQNTDLNSPDEVFKFMYPEIEDSFTSRLLFINQPGVSHYNSTALAERLLSEDITITSEIFDISNTQSAVEEITRIRTRGPHFVNGAAKVVFSGFEAPYDVLNGNEFLVVTDSCTRNHETSATNGFADYGDDPVARTIHNEFYIYYDSSGLPFNATTGRALFAGDATVSVTYKQITAAIEYRPFVSSVQYWVDMVTGGRINHWSVGATYDKNTKTGPSVGNLGIGPFKIPETWEEKKQLSESGNQIRIGIGEGTQPDYAIPAFYAATKYHYLLIFAVLAPQINVNHPFPINRDARFGDVRQDIGALNPSSLYSYAITRQNYITEAKTPFWRTAGGLTKFDPINFFAFFAYPGFNGDTFETKMFPYGQYTTPGEGWSLFFPTLPPNDYRYWGLPAATPDPYTALFPPFFMEALQGDFYAGLVNVSYTSGKKIGYIHMANANIRDFNGVSHFSHLAPVPQNGVRDEEEATMVFVAGLMQYLVRDLEVDDIIIDFRGDFKLGENQQRGVLALRSFFGTENATIINNGRYSHYDASGTTYTNDVDEVERRGSGQKYVRVRPSLSEALYPESVFVGGNVVIITGGTIGFSSTYFVNSTGGRDLGGNTNVKVIGTSDFPISGLNFRAVGILSFSGIQDARRPDIILNGRGPAIIPRYATGEFMSGRDISLTKPDQVSSLSGLSGSDALPVDAEHLLYPDVGHMPHDKLRLSGDTRVQQPIPNSVSDRGTWRDTWFELAVEEICLSKKRNTFSVKQRSELRKRGQRLVKRDIQSGAPKLMKCTLPSKSLALLKDAKFDHVLVYDNRRNSTEMSNQKFWHEFETMIDSQIKSGNICINSDGIPCITPEIGDMPKIELLQPMKAFPDLEQFNSKFSG